MANSSTGNPWKLDTAATIKTGPVKILAMEWRATATGDDLLVSDNAGNEIWSEKAIAGDSSEQIPLQWPLNGKGLSCSGFVLTTIDAGTLRVWIA